MKKIALLTIAVFTAALSANAQGYSPLTAQYLNYRFNPDSLRGFDEAAASLSAIDEGFTGTEYPVRMYQLKRAYIDNKYNINQAKKLSVKEYVEQLRSYTRMVPACTNEDFEEASVTTPVTTTNQINGWTVTRGLNQGSGNNSCNLNGCCPSSPQESMIFVEPNGLIDNEIGPQYPVYSVFGSNPGTTGAQATNTHIAGGVKGNAFFRLNSEKTNDYSMERLSKTFTVTPQTALFQFAFIAVFNVGHGCCDAGALKMRLFSGCSNPTVITCPDYTASAPSSACTNTAANIEWLNATGNGAGNPPGSAYSPTLTFGKVYSKWQISSLDLSFYLGQCITIEVVASDCTAGGHYGYVYFDAQCGPMTITGNGNDFPAGTTSMVVPTCGAAGATMCAVPGIGSYAWQGPGVPPASQSLSPLNQCYTSSISATYTLTMQPPGGCPPIIKQITTTITAAPLLNMNVTQAVCGNTVATATVVPGGSAGNPTSLTWWPPPANLTSNTQVATYVIPGGGPITISATAMDNLGCKVTATGQVMPAAPVPTYVINNLTNSYTIDCNNPNIVLDIQTTYTYGPLAYNWQSSSFQSGNAQVTLTEGGIYTVTATDNVSGCAKTQTLSIGVNTVVPQSANSPSYQAITCVSPAVGVTLTASNPTVNIVHTVISELGSSFVANTATTVLPVGGPGTYTHITTNSVNGCKTVKTITVENVGSDKFPTFNLSSTAPGYTLGCTTKSVITIHMNSLQTDPVGAAATATILTPGGGALKPGILSTNTDYSVNAPGTYTVVAHDNGTGCRTFQYQTVLSATLGPNIDTVIVPRPILNCFEPTTVLKGVTTHTNVEYRWNYKPSLQTLSDTVTVNANFAARTNSVVDNYTLTITNLVSTCRSTTVIPILQNLVPPIAAMDDGVSGTASLTCITNTIMLTNQSTHGSYNFPKAYPVIGLEWMGPTPQIPLEKSTSYVAFVPGTYTMVARDENNGCVSTATYVIGENRVVPIFENEVPGIIDCGQEATLRVAITTGTTGPFTYSWTPPANAVHGATTVNPLVTKTPGRYQLLVRNTTNGCFYEDTMSVTVGTLTPSFEVSPNFGYAPLEVKLVNTSETSAGSTSSITTVYALGSGNTETVLSNPDTEVKTVYNQPGTYTITMYAQKGSCVTSTTQVVQVETPSQLVVPNIFTPNGDGANDVFILQRATNLSEIHIKIVDRWGNLVYELNSSTGQIEWDGKNMGGKEAPDGIYFYTITAKGRDGKEYAGDNYRGSITLVR